MRSFPRPPSRLVSDSGMADSMVSLFCGVPGRRVPSFYALEGREIRMSDVVLELRRDGDLDEHGHVSGYLWAMRGRTGLVYFHTKEKGHGRVRLRPGTLTMEHSVMNHFPDVRCLRPLGQANAQLAVCLIHPVTRHVLLADTADALDGCIAPYLVGSAETPGSSDAAMEQLWGLLGGWRQGGTVELTILNDVPKAAL